MKQITVTLYDFRELPKETQEMIVEKHRNWNISDETWTDKILEKWKAKLETLGFKNPQIFFSDFGTQDKGACFTCDDIDLAKYIDHLVKQSDSLSQSNWLQVIAMLYINKLASAKICRVGDRSHESSMDLQFEYNIKTAHQQFLSLMDNIQQEMVIISQAIYKDLEDQHEYLTDDIAIMESFSVTTALLSSQNQGCKSGQNHRNKSIYL